jgi:hypothetical protein
MTKKNRSFTRRRSPILRAVSHFPSLREGIKDISPSVSMFTQDIPLAIMPINARDTETYYAKIVGSPRDVERADDVLRSLTRYDRTSVKELIADTITEFARTLAWYGRSPYEISGDEGENSQDVHVTSFTPRRLFVTPWFCLQVVPRAERDRLNKTFVFIPRRNVWIVEMPRSLGGYRGHRRMLRRLTRFHAASPAFWMKDLEASRASTSYFDFSVYRREEEVLQSRITRRWGWNHRDLSSKNWTEFALFYRMMTFRASQAILREHILLELNALLKRLDIKAEIKVSGLPTSENIFGLRSEMVFGNISYAKAYEVTSV